MPDAESHHLVPPNVTHESRARKGRRRLETGARRRVGSERWFGPVVCKLPSVVPAMGVPRNRVSCLRCFRESQTRSVTQFLRTVPPFAMPVIYGSSWVAEHRPRRRPRPRFASSPLSRTIRFFLHIISCRTSSRARLGLKILESGDATPVSHSLATLHRNGRWNRLFLHDSA